MRGMASNVSCSEQEVGRNLSLNTQIPILDSRIRHVVRQRRLESGGQLELRFIPIEVEREWVAAGNSQPRTVEPAPGLSDGRAKRVRRRSGGPANGLGDVEIVSVPESCSNGGFAVSFRVECEADARRKLLVVRVIGTATRREPRITGEIDSRRGIREDLADDALLVPVEAKTVDGPLRQSKRKAGLPTQSKTCREPRRYFPGILQITHNVRFTIAPVCLRTLIKGRHISCQEVRHPEARDRAIERVCAERGRMGVIVRTPVGDDRTECELMVSFYDIDLIRQLIGCGSGRRVAIGPEPQPINCRMKSMS